ncbi:hypothetical protein HYS50_04000 [Candidatus Woesearchaeota archaeon]|nr:hypothetical protein [Candidatus Woesearchaeota archaeon]
MYRVRKLTRDALLIATIVGGFLLLFSLQAPLSEKYLTGEVIQVGKPDSTKVVIGDQPKPKLPPPVAVDPKTVCWLQRGLKPEDFAIIGPLLQQAPCDSTPGKQQVAAEVKGSCLDISVGDSAATTLCVKEEQPSFSVQFPTPGTTAVSLPATKPNYWLALLLLFMGISILFIWGRVDLYRALAYRRQTSSREFMRLLPGEKEIEIRYIKPPPAYLKKIPKDVPTPSVRLQAAPQPAPAKTVEQPKRQPIIISQQRADQQQILSSSLNKSLIRFNEISQSLCDLLALKKFTEAEQHYPALYHLALDLYPKVTEENKPRLLRVVTALHDQLKELRDAYSVAREVRGMYAQEEKQQPPLVQVWEPAKMTLQKEQIQHLDRELAKLRLLLEGKRPTSGMKRAKHRFFP